MVFYPAFMLLLGVLSRKRKHRSFDEYPFVSVMVAARNEEKCIGTRIENLLQQDYPADRFEVLVASDVSTDSTDAIIKLSRILRCGLQVRGEAGKIRPHGETVTARQG